ncbi:MAG: FAD-dependent monooxygenase [Eubacterium sp.]|nr:FAD-dependent monooxygenase [Eubacterium sp.]
MLQLAQLKIPYQKDNTEYIKKKIARQLHLDVLKIHDLKISKKSIDARKKPDIFYIYTVQFSLPNEKHVLEQYQKKCHLTKVSWKPLLPEVVIQDSKNTAKKPEVTVIGAGPAGLFSAYFLCLCGAKVTLVERGKKVEERQKDIERFWQEGVLNSDSNVSFGEGGAGTFSDGKLNTGVKDRSGRKQFVLDTFVRFGARENILYDAKPHIGTDVLQKVLINMRKEMEELGCEFLFQTRLEDVIIEHDSLRGVRLFSAEKGHYTKACDNCILAIGHSARDTFSMLYEKGVAMTPKAFAMGVRVQHEQKDINRAQYGAAFDKFLAAPYKCTAKAKDGRGVYTFCMCPGGYVVNASSEENGLVVNGMSNVDRDSGYANSAVIVSVTPEDFPSDHPLAGVEFQRTWEKKAYQLCRGKIPVQRFGDFLNDRCSDHLGKVKPCTKGTWDFGNLQKALPTYVKNGIIDGLKKFSDQIENYDDEDTLLLGVETRTSSPVRIERDADFVSLNVKGLYPCGEGAGYAGGIMSAAMDGLRVAMKIVQDGGKHA